MTTFCEDRGSSIWVVWQKFKTHDISRVSTSCMLVFSFLKWFMLNFKGCVANFGTEINLGFDIEFDETLLRVLAAEKSSSKGSQHPRSDTSSRESGSAVEIQSM